MREMLMAHKEPFLELEKIQHQLIDHNQKFIVIFEYLKQFEQAKQQQLKQANRCRIGFKSRDKK